MNYARQWATDCLLEYQYHPKNECWFVTLTYNDEHLPQAEYKLDNGKTFKGISLRKKDVQDFWKRLRAHYGGKIMYLVAGEYGNTTERPHYHAIIFGLKLNTENFKHIGNNMNGDSLWTDPELEKVWGKGNIVIGQVTYQSVSYVARYTIKKWKNKSSDKNKILGRMPEFICMSQGIAKRYYQEHKEQIIKQDAVLTNDGLKPIPKRFMRRLEQENKDTYTTIKQKHKKAAEEAQAQQKTDLSPEAQRIKNETLRNNSFIDLRR